MRTSGIAVAALAVALLGGNVDNATAQDVTVPVQTVIDVDGQVLADCSACDPTEITEHRGNGIGYVEFTSRDELHNSPVTATFMSLHAEISWCTDQWGMIDQILPGEWHQRIIVPANPDYFCGYTPDASVPSFFQYPPSHLFLAPTTPDQLAKAAGLTNAKMLVS